MGMSEVGAGVRRLRLALGLGQVEFAKNVGMSTTGVSMLENGRATATDDLLVVLARELQCTPAHLQRGTASALSTQPLMRAYADAPKKTVDRQIADAALAVEVAAGLGLHPIADTLPIFHGDLASEHDIEQFALDVRAAAQLDDGDVVGNSIRAAERLGCLVLPMPDELGRHLGMSVRIDTTPVLCVSRATEAGGEGVPGDRQRFTVAHELGHLALHSHLAPPQTAQDATLFEKQAHLFAGAFLAPGDAMMEELQGVGGRVTLQTLAAIKSRWGLSIKSLVMRFRQLGVIDADHARSLYKQISARGYNKSEPVPVGPESATWMSKAISKRFAGSRDPLEDAAQSAGLGQEHFRRWVDWTPAPSPQGEVVLLPSRTATEQEQGGRNASVTRLAGRRG